MFSKCTSVGYLGLQLGELVGMYPIFFMEVPLLIHFGVHSQMFGKKRISNAHLPLTFETHIYNVTFWIYLEVHLKSSSQIPILRNIWGTFRATFQNVHFSGTFEQTFRGTFKMYISDVHLPNIWCPFICMCQMYLKMCMKCTFAQHS